MLHNDHENPDERLSLNLPSLLIPYWDPGDRGPTDPGDRGDLRPTPPNIIPYLCEGIKTLAPYQPGKPLTVTVSVRNWGGGVVGSIATVRIWWEFPAPSYAVLNPSRLVGVTSIVVPPRGSTNTTKPITYTFPSLPPPHVCLIACVDHPLDQPPKRTNPAQSLIPLPGLDRHWAQRNLSYVPATPTGTINFPFMTSNPFEQEAEFVLEARPFVRERLEKLIRIVRAEPIEIEARFEMSAIRDLRDAQSERHDSHRHSVFLEPGGRTSLHLRIQLSEVPAEGQFAAFELLQYHRNDKRSMGGIALIVLAPIQEKQ
jgi:hypothetical protein